MGIACDGAPGVPSPMTKGEKAWWGSFSGQREYVPGFARRPRRCPTTKRWYFWQPIVLVYEALFDDRHSIDRKLGPSRLTKIIPRGEWHCFYVDMIRAPEAIGGS